MAEATVRIPGPLREYAGGRSEVVVALPHAPLPLDTLLRLLGVDCPGVLARTLDERGALRRHMNVFVGEENARDVDGLQTPVHDGAEVSIIPAISGG